MTDEEDRDKEEFWGSPEAEVVYLDWRKQENMRIARQVGEVASSFDKPKVFEVGLGRGPLTRLILPKVGEYWGIEPVPADLERSIDELNLDPERSLCLRAEDLDTCSPFDTMDGYFDIIVMVSVLEHVPNPAEILTSLRRLLKKGGVLIISVPDSTRFRFFHKLRTLCGIEPWSYFHISFFSDTSLDQLFLNLGFSVADRRRASLLTDKSIKYYEVHHSSRLLGLAMKAFKLFQLDNLAHMETIFYVLKKE
ncbi:class I SAM-dependent methyltransferase [Pseudodesulfovibrio profundus]|uniref:class I SAM-dependent methyltransferase n=1 Tax=Pseudodesulfovibrio profundus TaxID=57320 RepID=UPI00138FAEA3|nr:class I SAM-dependent methyltransferase [Pseudodesulfovibrio profundus]